MRPLTTLQALMTPYHVAPRARAGRCAWPDLRSARVLCCVVAGAAAGAAAAGWALPAAAQERSQVQERVPAQGVATPQESAGANQQASGLAQTAPVPGTSERLEQLEQTVKVLERRAEVAEELAAAQASQAAQAGQAAQASQAAQLKLGDGITVSSANRQVQLKLGGLLQADGRKFFGDDDRVLVDQFLIRRARLSLEGSYADWLKWQFRPEFVAGTAVTQDASVDLKLASWLTVRAGKQKVEFGLERAQNDAAVRFVERAYPTQLAPNRDVGVQLLGDLWHKRVAWAVGVFDGAIDNSVVEGDVNDSKEVNASLRLRPFATDEADALSSLSVGAAVTWGEQDGTDAAPQLPAFKSPGQASVYAFRTGEKGKDAAGSSVALPNPVARGNRLRWTANLWWNGGPFAVLGEFVQSQSSVARAASSAAGNAGTAQAGDWQASAWQGALSYVLGGKPTFAGTEVDQPFAIGADGWGALELVARASGLRIEDNGFATWADPAKSVRGALSVTGGARWHLSAHYRLFLDVEHTRFDGGKASGDRSAENVLLARVQVAY